MISGRSIVASTALWVGLHLVLMAVTLQDSSRPLLSVLAAVLVVLATGSAVRPLVGGGRRLGTAHAVALLATVPVAAALVTPFLGPEAVLGYANWWPGAVGPLLTAVVLRRHGTAVVVASICAALVLALSLDAVLPATTSRAEALASLSTHLVLWPAAGAALALLFRHAERTVTLLGFSVDAARDRAQGVHVLGEAPARLLAVASPVLQAISHGDLIDGSIADEARLLESRLRDELRAGALLDDTTREGIDLLRERRWTVDLDDHAAPADVDAGRSRTDLVRAVAVDVVAACVRDGASGARLAVLVPQHSSFLVSVVVSGAPAASAAVEQAVRLAAGDHPVEVDHDDGDLWLAVG